jgi:hypothetical protein
MSKNANFKHGAQTLVTPTELRELAKSLAAPNHEEFGLGSDFEPSDDPTEDRYENYLYQTGADRYSASGECEKASRWTRPYLPEGTQTIQLLHHKDTSWVDMSGNTHTAPLGNHYINVVPTTEGPHVVDFTHRQYQNTAAVPVVQHINDFMKRSSMKNYIIDLQHLSPTLRKNLGE